MSLKQTEAMNIINVRHYNIIQGNNGYSRTVGMLHYSTAGWLEPLTKSIFVLIEIQMRQGRRIVIHYLMWVEHIPTSHTYIEKCSSLNPPPLYYLSPSPILPPVLNVKMAVILPCLFQISFQRGRSISFFNFILVSSYIPVLSIHLQS